MFATSEFRTLRESYLLRLEFLLPARVKHIFAYLYWKARELVIAACENKPDYNPK